MRIKKVPFASQFNTPAGLRIIGGPVYTLNTEAQVAVPVDPILQLLWNGSTPPFTVMAYMRNSSTGGQQIRVGNNPSFASTRGHLLMPGDTLDIRDITTGYQCTGNVAGGLLDVSQFISN